SQAHIELLRAKDILQELYLAAPKDGELQFQLARCLNELLHPESMNDWGVLFFAAPSRGLNELRHPERLNEVRSGAATDPFEGRLSSVSLAASLVAQDPNNPDYLALLGRSYKMTAFRYSLFGQYRNSEAALRRAVDTLGRAHHAAPQDAEAARWL